MQDCNSVAFTLRMSEIMEDQECACKLLSIAAAQCAAAVLQICASNLYGNEKVP